MKTALRLIYVPDSLCCSFHCIEGCNVLKLAIAVEVLCSLFLFVSANFGKCFIKGYDTDCSLYCTRAEFRSSLQETQLVIGAQMSSFNYTRTTRVCVKISDIYE